MKHAEFASASKGIEGFTLKTLLSFLAPHMLGEEHLRRTLAMIAVGGGIAQYGLVPLEETGATIRLLVNGRERTLVLQHTDASGSRLEKHLAFFPQAGLASPTTLQVRVSNSQHMHMDQRYLTRDEYYRYWLDGQWVHVVSTGRETVCLEVFDADASKRHHVSLSDHVFWPFVFDYRSDGGHREIGTAHVAALLGIDRKKTLLKHLAMGNLPTSDARVAYPGITLQGLQEFVAYRQQFPQGQSNSVVVERWRTAWREENH